MVRPRLFRLWVVSAWVRARVSFAAWLAKKSLICAAADVEKALAACGDSATVRAP